MERDGRAKLLSRGGVPVRQRELEAGVYVVLPSEDRSMKDLRIIADAVMLSTAPLWSRVDVYLESFPNVDGINKYVRTNMFPGPKRCKRDEKAPPTDTASGKLPRGRPRKGTQRSDEQLQMAAEARKESVRNIQRQSKQRGRCENKLLALFFACLYDTSARTSALTDEIPPLHKTVAAPSGKRGAARGNVRTSGRPSRIRKISNYPAVRSCLRKIMCELISLQAVAIRTIVSVGSPIADLLPSCILNVVRTVLVSYSLQSELLRATDGNEMNKGDGDTDVTCTQLRQKEVLNSSLDSLVSNLSDWWRRNYTPDNQLQNCQNVTRSHALISASESLVSSIIELSLWHDSARDRGDPSWLYGYGCVGGQENHEEGKFMISKMDSTDVAKMVEPCHHFVEAITKCNNLLGHCSIEERQEFLRSTPLTVSLPLWGEMYAQSVLHKMQSLSAMVKKLDLKCNEVGNGSTREVETRTVEQAVDEARLDDYRRELVQTVCFHVGKFCNSLLASNEKTLSYLRNIGARDVVKIRELAMQVVYLGSVGAEILMENETSIFDLTERLFAISKEVSTEVVDAEEDMMVEEAESCERETELNPDNIQDLNHDEDRPVRSRIQIDNGNGGLQRDETDGVVKEPEHNTETPSVANVVGESEQVRRVGSTENAQVATKRNANPVVEEEHMEQGEAVDPSDSDSPPQKTVSKLKKSARPSGVEVVDPSDADSPSPRTISKLKKSARPSGAEVVDPSDAESPSREAVSRLKKGRKNSATVEESEVEGRRVQITTKSKRGKASSATGRIPDRLKRKIVDVEGDKAGPSTVTGKKRKTRRGSMSMVVEEADESVLPKSRSRKRVARKK